MSNQTDWRHHKYSKDRRYFAIHAGKSLKGSDVVQVMDTITFGNQALPKRLKVDNGSEFIKIFPAKTLKGPILY